MNKENFDSNKYFDSGLYEKVFYTKHRALKIDEEGIIADIEYNRTLLTDYWQDIEEFEGTEDVSARIKPTSRSNEKPTTKKI